MSRPTSAKNLSLISGASYTGLSRRSYYTLSDASSWEELWEAGSYYTRLSELLEDAQHYAIFTGWQIDSRVRLNRPERPGQAQRFETFKEKILRLCDAKPDFHAYFLMWDYAYFYVLEREFLQGRVWDSIHPRVHFLFDNRHPFGGSHHEKIALIDGRTALCGGIDICDERWDTPQHFHQDPRRSLDWKNEHHGPYHDLAVQVNGPICGEIQKHISQRWCALSSIPFPESPALLGYFRPGTGHSVYFSRTVMDVHAGERETPMIREIEFLFRDLIFEARERIILEGQYYWSKTINDLLMAKIQMMEGKQFEIILILASIKRLRSLSRQMAYAELTLLQQLQDAAHRNGIRLILACPFSNPETPSSRHARPKPIYVHSKVIVVDDQYLSIGSANLATRALRLDTELQLTLEARNDADRAHIRRVGDQILRHWNFRGSGPSHIQLRELRAGEELRRLKKRHPVLSRFPWPLFFDPRVPWAYFFNLWYRKLERRSWILWTAPAAYWLIGYALTLGAASLIDGNSIPSLWRQAYALLLSASWLLPIPFLAVSFLAVAQFGLEAAMPLIVASLWIAAFSGYVLARVLPAPTRRAFSKLAPPWLPYRLGLRTFPQLLIVLADPRIGLRTKIVFQGLYWVPLPWFALGTLLVLPSAVYLACRIMHESLLRAGNEGLRLWLANHSLFLLGIIVMFVGLRIAFSLLKRTERL